MHLEMSDTVISYKNGSQKLWDAKITHRSIKSGINTFVFCQSERTSPVAPRVKRMKSRQQAGMAWQGAGAGGRTNQIAVSSAVHSCDSNGSNHTNQTLYANISPNLIRLS